MTGGQRPARRYFGPISALFALLAACSGPVPATPKPKLMVLTGLPLLFGEGFSIDAEPTPVIEALGKEYELVAIGATDPQALRQGRLLMMAQPRAQTAENLVALDQWVRDGGRLLLFADPRLEWESGIALGDPTRPPPMFADTGLLGHWGLRLDAPDQPGPAAGQLGGHAVRTRSPGTLIKTGAGCSIEDGGLVARCSVGKGRALIVADADLLDARQDDQGHEQAVIDALASLSK